MSAGFFADDPADGSADAPDRLGREPYAEKLVGLLDRVATTSRSSVLALIGPWGGGKSSVMEMTLSQLRGTGQWEVTEFNPWAYADLDAMIVGFFEEIIAALPKDKRPAQTRQFVAGLVRKISWVGKAGSLVGADLSDAMGGLGDLIEGDMSPSALRQRMVDALDDANQRILMVLDDLDRLAPAELLLIFKLVRFVGRLPNIFYLLAYDERTLLDVLARTELCGDSPQRARDYLEKIVQVRLDLPPLREEQATKMLRLGVDALTESVGAEVSAAAKMRFEKARESCLGERLNTPRAINRFLAQVDALYSFVGVEVDFVDFVLLTFIRTFEPTLYAAMSRMRERLAVSTTARGRASEDPWARILGLSGVSEAHAEGIEAVLRLLFPESDGDRDAVAVYEMANSKRVGHGDYFDRYFAFMVPEEELSDAETREILGALPDLERESPRISQLILMLITDPERWIRKIDMRRPHDPAAAAALLIFLARQFGDLSDVPGAASLSPRGQVERLVEKLVEEAADLASTAFAEAYTALPGGLLLTRVLAVREAARSVLADFSERVEHLLRPYLLTPFPEVPVDVKELLHAWNLADRKSCRTWLQSQIGAEGWDPLDLVGWKIQTTTEEGQARLDSIPPEAVENLLGIDFLLGLLRDRLNDSVPDRSPYLDTPQDRREAALLALHRLLTEKST